MDTRQCMLVTARTALEGLQWLAKRKVFRRNVVAVLIDVPLFEPQTLQPWRHAEGLQMLPVFQTTAQLDEWLVQSETTTVVLITQDGSFGGSQQAPRLQGHGVERLLWVATGEAGLPQARHYSDLTTNEQTRVALREAMESRRVHVQPARDFQTIDRSLPFDCTAWPNGRDLKDFWTDPDRQPLLTHLLRAALKAGPDVPWNDLARTFFSCPVCMVISTAGLVCVNGHFTCAKCTQGIVNVLDRYSCAVCRSEEEPRHTSTLDMTQPGAVKGQVEDTSGLPVDEIRFVYELCRLLCGRRRYSTESLRNSQEDVLYPGLEQLIDVEDLQAAVMYQGLTVAVAIDYRHAAELIQHYRQVDACRGLVVFRVSFTEATHMDSVLEWDSA